MGDRATGPLRRPKTPPAAQAPAWTLPRFRRALFLEFAAGGILFSSVTAAIVAASAAGTPVAALVAGAAGLAAFSLAGGLCLVPGTSPDRAPPTPEVTWIEHPPDVAPGFSLGYGQA